MISITKTYDDFNGVSRTETFWFNLTEAEITEMEMGTEGGFAESVQRVIDAKDAPTIINIFKELVLKAYGEKSPDGRYFYKNDEIRARFMSTQAYSDIFMELATDSDAASKFVNGIAPKKKSLKGNTTTNTNLTQPVLLPVN